LGKRERIQKGEHEEKSLGRLKDSAGVNIPGKEKGGEKHEGGQACLGRIAARLEGRKKQRKRTYQLGRRLKNTGRVESSSEGCFRKGGIEKMVKL